MQFLPCSVNLEGVNYSIISVFCIQPGVCFSSIYAVLVNVYNFVPKICRYEI